MANIVVVLAADALDEPDETAVIRIGAPVHALAGPSDTYTLTLLDDDDPPTVAFASVNQATGEGAGLVTVDVILSSASGFELEIPFTVGGTATHLDDFLVSPDPPLIVVPAGQVVGVVAVTVLDDALDEPDETVLLSLGLPSNASLGEPALHTLTILDDDAPPTLAFVTTSAVIGEADGTASFTVQLTAVSGQDVVVPYSVAGTADQPDDYSIAASPLLIPAGQASADIDVSIADDGVGESDETVVVTLGTPTNADLGLPAQSELVILDDDPPVVEFVAASQSTPEGAVAIAVVRLSKVAPLDVTVPFTVAGTADDPDDYTISSSPLVIPAGQQTVMLDFVLADDTLYEGDETILVTLATPVNGMLGGQSSHALTILDDDAPPMVQFATAAQATVEPNPFLIVVTVELSELSGIDLLVPYTLGGTATNPDDYSIQQSPIAIPAGAISANIAVAMVDDALGEIDETIELTLVAPPGSSLGAISVHTITIFDNDGGPGPESLLVLEPAAWTMFVGETVTLTALGQQVDDVVWRIVEPLAGDFRDTGSATTCSNPAQFVGGRYPGDWRVTVSNMTTGAEASMRVTLLPLELTFHDLGVTKLAKAPQRGPAWARSVFPASPAFDALPLVAIDPRGLATGPIIHVVLGGPDGAILSLDRGGVPLGASPIAPEVDLSAMRAIAVDPEGGVMLAGERALVRVHGGVTEVWIPEIPVVGIQDLSVGPRGAIWIAAFDDAERGAGSIRVLNAIGREIKVIREFQVDGSLRVLRRPLGLAVGPDGSIHIFEELPWDGIGDRRGVSRIVAEPTIAPGHR